MYGMHFSSKVELLIVKAQVLSLGATTRILVIKTTVKISVMEIIAKKNLYTSHNY